MHAMVVMSKVSGRPARPYTQSKAYLAVGRCINNRCFASQLCHGSVRLGGGAALFRLQGGGSSGKHRSRCGCSLGSASYAACWQDDLVMRLLLHPYDIVLSASRVVNGTGFFSRQCGISTGTAEHEGATL
jgi:hypothetical protein